MGLMKEYPVRRTREQESGFDRGSIGISWGKSIDQIKADTARLVRVTGKTRRMYTP